MSKHDNTTTQPPAPERAKLHLGYLPDLIAANRRPLDHQAPQALWDAGLIWRSNRGTWGLSDAGRALLDDILKLLRGEARLAEPESEAPPSPTSRAIHLDLADFSDTAKKLGVDLVRTDPDGTAHLTEAGGALLHGTLERLRAEPPPATEAPQPPDPDARLERMLGLAKDILLERERVASLDHHARCAADPAGAMPLCLIFGASDMRAEAARRIAELETELKSL